MSIRVLASALLCASLGALTSIAWGQGISSSSGTSGGISGAASIGAPAATTGGAAAISPAPAANMPSRAVLTPSAPAPRAGEGATAANDTGANPSPALPSADRSSDPGTGLTEFQKFVRDATGRSLPLFGYSLFQRTAFPAVQNVPVPADYVVGPGDEIDLKVWGGVDAEVRLVVDRNGQVTVPRVGTLNVAGVRASELENTFRARIGRVFNNFQLSATLGQLRSIQVFVVGNARRPGAYVVSSLSTLVSALFESGGPAPTGSMRRIQLRRGGQLVSTFDVYKFINEGDKSADARLMPGDVIVIPPAGPRVAVSGAVDEPAIYELENPEEPLGKVLSYGGRTPVLASPHRVQLERIDSSRPRAPRTVEVRSLDAAGLKAPVKDGDLVTLLRISPEFANAVTLRGNVAAPLRYPYRPGMRVSDLVPEREALIVPDYYIRRNLLVQIESGRDVPVTTVQGQVKNLLPEINWDYAVVERLDPKEVRSNLIPFNLAKAVIDRDPANDIVLQPGDVVTVFGVNDLPVPVSKRTRYVRLSGEVNVPGVYQLEAGETLDQLLRRASGFTRDAYPYGTTFTRESTRLQQQANLDRAMRILEADVNSQAIAALQSARDEKNAASIQANMMAQRDLVARLNSLKATGRIALELHPAAAAFPPIVLEDGDAVTVPPVPSFVSVFGAVTAESSFVHRSNYTVRDYIERAGPTRDADLDSLVIVRADGSAESRSGSGVLSFWGSDFMGKRLNPGDAVFVPERFDKRSGYTRFIDDVKDWTQIFYQFGLGAAGLKVLKN